MIHIPQHLMVLLIYTYIVDMRILRPYRNVPSKNNDNHKNNFYIYLP